MIRPLIIVALCAAVLAACQPLDRERAAAPDTGLSPDRARRLMLPPMARSGFEEAKPRTAPLPRRRPEELAVALAQPPESEAPQDTEPGLDIDQLVGLDFAQTMALLGHPALDEVQAPARVWAYNGSGCVLSIFFYPHVDGTTYRALTYEVKGGDDSAEFRNHCFTELVKERAKEGT